MLSKRRVPPEFCGLANLSTSCQSAREPHPVLQHCNKQQVPPTAPQGETRGARTEQLPIRQTTRTCLRFNEQTQRQMLHMDNRGTAQRQDRPGSGVSGRDRDRRVPSCHHLVYHQFQCRCVQHLTKINACMPKRTC